MIQITPIRTLKENTLYVRMILFVKKPQLRLSGRARQLYTPVSVFMTVPQLVYMYFYSTHVTWPHGSACDQCFITLIKINPMPKSYLFFITLVYKLSKDNKLNQFRHSYLYSNHVHEIFDVLIYYPSAWF